MNPFLFPSRWPFFMLMGKSGRAIAIFLGHPFLCSAGTPFCRSEQRSSWPLCRSLCVPLHPLCISETTVLTSTRNFCPCWPCSREYRRHLGAPHLLPVFVECRSFTGNHWFVLVSSNNKLHYQ